MFFHVWFSPKQRKWLLQGDLGRAVQEILFEVSRDHDIRLLACRTVVDHVHLLLDLRESQNLTKAMQLLKGVSARKVFARFPDLKVDAGVLHFWQRAYGCRVVPAADVARVAEYIRTQWDRLESFDRWQTPQC